MTRLPFGYPETEVPLRAQRDAAAVVDTEAAHKVEVGIPMRDGVELAADVYLPPAAARPAPAVVVGTPYNKDSSGADEEVARFNDAGYALVRFDSRGRGKSEGEFQPFSMQDGIDGHDVVEWIAGQDWCTGAVGIKGLSYPGWITMATVSQKPPHLRAAIPISAPGRWQQEIPYTHGCLQIFFAWWWALVRRRINDSLLGAPELLQILPVEAMGDVLRPAGGGWREMLEHEALDELWRSRRWDGAYDFDVPCLHVTGWHDREDIHGAFHHYEQMAATSPARERQWLLVGPWTHVSCALPSDTFKGVRYPGGALDAFAIQIRFFDRFLKGEENGVDDEPRVQLYDTGARSWQVRPAWQGGTREHRLYLAADGALADAPGAGGETSYRYDPLRPNGLEYPLDVLPLEPPLDLSGLEAQEGVVSWTSEPLAEPLTVHGWGELELWAETDGDDVEWHAKLADVGPDGVPLWVGWGCLRASHADDPGAPAPVVPGETRRYAVELTPAFHTFQPGHRLRLLLAGSEFPWFARNLNRFEPIATQSEPRVATNTVRFGSAHPSCVRLRVE
ncbi:MAG TPA: CocE/NonD family hydrolase [Gaiellaceae bacterium]|nr:CocE/NonD family hydrolase [Gaiellaceae bacterium]